MTSGEPSTKTSGDPRTDEQVRLDAEINALMQKRYGQTLAEFCGRWIEKAFKAAEAGSERRYVEAHKAGYARGHADAYRKAKGQKKSTRIEAGNVANLADNDQAPYIPATIEVMKAITVGQAELANEEVPADVKAFLRTQGRSPWPKGWPTKSTLISERSRQRKKARERLGELLHFHRG